MNPLTGPSMHNRIKGLDGLRAIAVLLVIMSHALIWPRLGVTDRRVLSVIGPHNAVQIFFVLSGFLITYLLIREESKTGSINIVDFYIRRILRIFPLYFLALGLLYVVDRTGSTRISECSFDYAFTYTINFAPPECQFSSMSHFWSLAVEEHFYLVWPFVFLAGRKFAIGFSTAFIVASTLLATPLADAFPDARTSYWTLPAAAPIGYGCLVAFLTTHPSAGNVASHRVVRKALLPLMGAGIISPAFGVDHTIWLASIAALVFFVYCNQDSLIVRALEFRPLALIGTMSYGLYVWQGVFTGNGPYRVPHSSFPPSVDLGLLIAILVTPISFYYFESPILKLKRHFSWRHKANEGVAPGIGTAGRRSY